jgi:hypothetical protein
MEPAVASTVPAALVAGENQDLGEGESVGVGNRQERRRGIHRCEPPGGAAVKLQLRRTAAPHDLDVAPENAA